MLCAASAPRRSPRSPCAPPPSRSRTAGGYTICSRLIFFLFCLVLLFIALWFLFSSIFVFGFFSPACLLLVLCCVCACTDRFAQVATSYLLLFRLCVIQLYCIVYYTRRRVVVYARSADTHTHTTKYTRRVMHTTRTRVYYL